MTPKNTAVFFWFFWQGYTVYYCTAYWEQPESVMQSQPQRGLLGRVEIVRVTIWKIGKVFDNKLTKSLDQED